MLRTYLSESAIALYLDRFARLNQRYDRTDLEAVERVWALRAIDERWQRHLVEMQVLRSSVNVRAFGQLDPMEEYRIDGARAFVDMVRDMRRKTVANVFFFVGSAVEPVLDFEEVAAEEAAAVANPAAAEREAEIAKVMQATGMTSMADFISADEDAESETVLVEAQRRAASAGKKMQAMDDGEEKKMLEEAERVLAKQRALIEEEEDLDGDGDDGSVTYKF
jgi:preprotein translocase subunit SecA